MTLRRSSRIDDFRLRCDGLYQSGCLRNFG